MLSILLQHVPKLLRLLQQRGGGPAVSLRHLPPAARERRHGPWAGWQESNRGGKSREACPIPRGAGSPGCRLMTIPAPPWSGKKLVLLEDRKDSIWIALLGRRACGQRPGALPAATLSAETPKSRGNSLRRGRSKGTRSEAAAGCTGYYCSGPLLRSVGPHSDPRPPKAPPPT